MPVIGAKKTAVEAVVDETSASAWKALLEAAQAVNAMVWCAEGQGSGCEVQAATMRQHLIKATRLTPASTGESTRSAVPSKWSFMDYKKAATVCVELRLIVLEMSSKLVGICPEMDKVRGDALLSVVASTDALGPYTELCKRERAFERLIGDESDRRRS